MGEMITIPVEEYAALQAARDDLADLQAYGHAKAALARGEDEVVPAEVARRLIEGDSPLRVWREYRALTQQALSEAARVNRVQIAEIEAGRKSGSVTTVRKLARALGVSIDDLA
jgi:mRNA interferase RelE/StbE